MRVPQVEEAHAAARSAAPPCHADPAERPPRPRPQAGPVLRQCCGSDCTVRTSESGRCPVCRRQVARSHSTRAVRAEHNTPKHARTQQPVLDAMRTACRGGSSAVVCEADVVAGASVVCRSGCGGRGVRCLPKRIWWLRRPWSAQANVVAEACAGGAGIHALHGRGPGTWRAPEPPCTSRACPTRPQAALLATPSRWDCLTGLSEMLS